MHCLMRSKYVCVCVRERETMCARVCVVCVYKNITYIYTNAL